MKGGIVAKPGFASGVDIGVEPYEFFGVSGADKFRGMKGPTEMALPAIAAFCGYELELFDTFGLDRLIPDCLRGDGVEEYPSRTVAPFSFHLS